MRFLLPHQIFKIIDNYGGGEYNIIYLIIDIENALFQLFTQ